MKRGIKKSIFVLLFCLILGIFFQASVLAEDENAELTSNYLGQETIEVVDDLQTTSGDDTLQTTAQEGDYIYATINGGVKIVDYLGETVDLVVPETLGGKKVISLDTRAFYRCNARSINLPDNIVSIGFAAFSECSNLRNISIPYGVKVIEGYTFENCTNLSSISLPVGIETIKERAFLRCSSLNNVNLPNGIKKIYWGAFEGCRSLSSISIPEGIATIDVGTFEGCRNLSSINLPNSLISIERNAFSGCAMSSINLPNNLLKIGSGAFYACFKLEKVELSENFESLACNAFTQCFALASIQFNSPTTKFESTGGDYIDRTITIIGYDPSTAKTYADKNGNWFESISSLQSVAISSPATKLNYQIGEPLDIDGLVVIGKYNDGTTRTETVTLENISGFDSSKVAENQLITINVKGMTVSYTIKVTESETGINCSYRTHVQNEGWQNWKTNGGMSGTSGKSFRLEGIEIYIYSQENIGVQYSTHIENIGWQEPKTNGETSGTEGKGLRLEAISISLVGAEAERYDIYYQVHAQNFGWLDWAKNGDEAGTAGFGYRLEGIKIIVVPKGELAPGATARPFVQN